MPASKKSTSRDQSEPYTKATSFCDSFRLGQEAYAQGSYEDALNYSVLACHSSRVENLQDQLQALDLKCSVLVKLDKLDAALDSAKVMIRADRQNARGYCRSASVEKLRGDLPAAIKYLEYGKTHVPESDKLYQYLISQLTKTKDALSIVAVIQRPIDPVTILPLELLQMVIAHTEYEQVVLMLRVSRSWKRILSKLEPLLTTLDFSKSKKQISQLMLRAALDRTLYPKTVAIYNVSPSAMWQVLKAFSHPSKFASLEHLSINNFKMSTNAVRFEKLALKSLSIGMECELGIGQVFSILNQCPLLLEATFKRVKISPVESQTRHERLLVLEIGNTFDLSAFSIPPLCFSHYPNLRSLTVNGAAVSTKTSWDLSANQNLRYLDIYASVIRSIQLPKSLEQWLWDGSEVAQFVNTRETRTMATPLPNLHTICLSGENTPAVLKYLYASEMQNDQLRRIGLHNRQGVAIISGTGPELQLLGGAHSLSLECEVLQDQDIDHFTSRFPEIRTLQLAAPRITGAFIADLLKRPGNQICKLVLKDCRNVSPDTVTWARAHGVHVEVHLGQVMVRGGRRLREGWF